MDYKSIVKKLTINKSDLYTRKIILNKCDKELNIKLENNSIFQTDATCWKKENSEIIFSDFNYVLIRKFNKQVNMINELFYDIDELKDNGIEIEDFFPIYPTISILNYYFNYIDVTGNTKKKCINYAKILNKKYYR